MLSKGLGVNKKLHKGPIKGIFYNITKWQTKNVSQLPLHIFSLHFLALFNPPETQDVIPLYPPWAAAVSPEIDTENNEGEKF